MLRASSGIVENKWGKTHGEGAAEIGAAMGQDLQNQFGRMADNEKARANLVGLFKLLLEIDAKRSAQ